MQIFLIFVAGALAVTYATIIFWVIKNWKKIPEWSVPENWNPTGFVSVILPGRNEIENIDACLDALLNQNYPSDLFEIIFIDDHSTDGTYESVLKKTSPLIRAYKNEKGSGKKSALDFGIKNARGNLIVTTDSDCLVEQNWLRLLVSFSEENNAEFIAGPVNFYREKNTFERFQSLDYIGMMGVTGAGIVSKKLSLANGANLSYRKSSFDRLGGFEGIDQIASGDDMLLLEKFQKAFPNDVHFLKSPGATVFTKAKPTVSSFISQRLRWAGKTSHYKNRKTAVVQSGVGAFSLFIFLSLLLAPFFGKTGLKLFAFSFLFKAIVDYFFLKKMTAFFKREDLMGYFLSAQIWHILYIVLVGIGSFFWKKTEWKGRKI